MDLPDEKLQFLWKVLGKFFEAKAAGYRMIRQPAGRELARRLRSPSFIILRKHVFLLQSLV